MGETTQLGMLPQKGLPHLENNDHSVVVPDSNTGIYLLGAVQQPRVRSLAMTHYGSDEITAKGTIQIEQVVVNLKGMSPLIRYYILTIIRTRGRELRTTMQLGRLMCTRASPVSLMVAESS